MQALLAILAVTLCNSAHAQERFQLLQHHVRPEIAQGKARLLGAMPGDQRLNFSIVLPLQNESELDQLLGKLYDPSSSNYRQFLSVAEFTSRFAPTEADYASAVAFARACGFEVTSTPSNRMVVPVSGTVDAINKAFHLQMSLYQHPTENRVFFSPDREPMLALNVPVAHVAGLNNFSLPKPMVKQAPDGQTAAAVNGSGPGNTYLASDMRAAYYGATQLTGDGQAVGLLEFGGYSLSDVNETFATAGQSYSVAINNVLLDGAIAEPLDGYGDGEQVLDIVQAIGMAPGLNQVRVYIGNGNDDANVLNSMASENIAKVLSCSWSWLPDDPATDDVFFKEFAAQGQTFLAASGDYGAYDAAINPYFYPQEDQYVTAVGGTHLTTSSAGGAWSAETVWNDGEAGSGGGVSPDGISLPSWQTGVATVGNGGSTTLRNVPDVAMEADFDNYNCELGTCFGDWGGTSFAAPRWAGFIALVNQQAVEAGTAPKGGVGFLNPSLYTIGGGSQNGPDFHDIVSGNNETDGQPVWYNAMPGYDLVTGWGSPTGQDLINDLAGKQITGFWLSPSSHSIAVNPGASASTTISVVDAGGFSGKVQMAVTSALPTGVTASWGTNPTSDSSVLTLQAASTAPNTTTPVTITGTSGSVTETTEVALTIHPPSFSLSTVPGNLDLGTGMSAAATVFVSPLYGFTGSVKLTVSGLPAGVTATFGTNPTTGSSLLTLSARTTAATGTGSITITGTSGSLTATTTLSLTVHTPTFELFNSGDMNIGAGTSATSYIFIQSEFGFSGSVAISIAGLPVGVTASFNPNPAYGYSILTLTANNSTALGTTALTVTGVSGKITATTSFKLNVLPPTFALSMNSPVTVGRGTSTTASLWVIPEFGFTGLVKLAVSGLPSGVTASFSQNPVIGNTSLLLTAASTASLGTSTVTVTGTSGSLTKTTTFSLGVFVPTFALSDGGNVVLGQGSSASTPILVYPEYGFTGSVQLTVSGLPAGVTASVSPNPVTGTAGLLLTATSSVAVGESTITVTGVSGTQTAKTTFLLEVLQPAFTLTGPGTVTLGTGGSVSSTVGITPEYGFAGSVSLSVAGLPSGVTTSFPLNPTSGSSPMILSATSAAKPGTYTVTLTGAYGTKTATTTFPLVVVTPGFTLQGQSPVALGIGTSTTAWIDVQPENGFAGTVHLAAAGLPSGVTATFSPDLVTGQSELTLTSTSATPAGTSTITITGTSGTLTATTSISVTTAAPSFTLSASPVDISPGESATGYINVFPAYGFTGSVTLSISGLPAGITASFAPNPTNESIPIALTATGTAAAGTYTATVKGISGSQTATTTFTLNVSSPLSAFNLSAPATVDLAPGSATTAAITINTQVALPGQVSLAVSGLPSGVTAVFSPNPTNGSSVLTLTAAKTVSPGSATLTINGSIGKLTATTTIQVQIQQPAFTLSGPGNLNLAQGGTMTGYVYIAPEYGFTGSVNLAVSGLPAGVTASWSQNPTTGYSTLNLSALKTTAAGTTTVTITGTSGTLKASTTFVLAVASPTFSVAAASGTLVGQGTSTPTGVFVEWPSGFSDTVSLSISGLPAGVTASFSPVSTSSYSVLTLTASSTAVLGQYNATVTGTYGKETSTALLNFTVVAPAFTLANYPASQLGQGGSTTSTINVNPQYGFNGTVHFSVVGLPAGVTASFSPNPSTDISTLTLTASATASVGQYTATIVGTSGKLSASQPISISIYAPSFALSAYQGPTISPGSSGQASVTVQSLYGFIGSVTLSVSGLPAGVTASLLPNPSADSSTVTINAAATATPGQYYVTVSGVSGKQTATTTMLLTIAAPSFTIVGAGSAQLDLGQSATMSLSISAQNGFNKAVTFVASGLPAGVTASFSPNPTTSNTTLKLSASTSASQGEYLITVSGTGGGQTAVTQISLMVGSPSFTLNGLQPLALGQGGLTTQYVYVNPALGFSGAVNLSVTGLPAGVVASFSPNPVTSSSLLTLAASSSATPGLYYATVVGTSGTRSVTTPFTLTVGLPSFSLYANGTTLGQGSSTTTSIYITPALGFSGAVNFSITGLPSGVTAAFSPNPAENYTVLTLTASSTVPAGNYVATITGTSGTIKASTPLDITLAPPGFSLDSNGPSQLGQGSTSQAWIYVLAQNGFTGNVELTASGLPTGVTASFSTNPTTSTSILTLTASSAAALGTYTFTVTGTSGSLHSSTTLTFSVVVPSFTLFCPGASLGQGNSTTVGVSVNGQNGFSANVQLAVSGLPSGVTASFSPNPTSGASTLMLQASSTAALGQYNITVTGTSGKQTVSAVFPLAIYVPTFTLTNYGGPVVIGRGTSATTTLYINGQYGFSGTVQMTASGLPSGVTASFSPNPAASEVTLTLTASSTALLGDYKFIVTGKSGSQTASTVVAVGVYVPTFTVNAAPNTAPMGQGTTSSVLIWASPDYGFTGSVQYAVSGLPSGVTASFSPNPTTGTTRLNLVAASTATLGQFPITVTGTSGSQTASTTLSLGVYIPTFTMAVYGDGGVIGQGKSITESVDVYAEYGFSGNVQLAASGLPSGVTATFSPNPTTNSSTLTLTASNTATLGQFTITVTGTSGSKHVMTTFPLGVYVPTFTLTDYSSTTLSPGSSGQSYVYVNPEYGFNGNVQLSVSGLPAGVTASFAPNPATSSSTLNLAAGTTVTPGDYILTLTGTSGSQKAATTTILTIN